MNTFERVVLEPFERLFERILQFLPNFLAALLIFALGIIIAGVVKSLFARVFRTIGIDKYIERTGVREMLAKGGIREPATELFARTLGWITLMIFMTMSLRALDVPSVEQLLQRLFLYLPNAFTALLVLFVGYLLSNFLGRAALIASVNAGIRISGLIGQFVRLLVLLLSLTMALEQLGIGSSTIIVAFAILFGGAVLAFSLAFGLGGRGLARTYLESRIRGEEEQDEINHL